MDSPGNSRFYGYFGAPRPKHEEVKVKEKENPIDFSCWGFQNDEERNTIQGTGNASPSSSCGSHRSLSPETHALIREEERCYLCMRCILPSAEPFVVLPCYDSCRSKFHFLCIVNTFWHFREAELVCPICTDPAYLVQNANLAADSHLEHEEVFGLWNDAMPNLRNTEKLIWCPEEGVLQDETLFSAYLKDPAKVRRAFSKKIYPILEKIMRNAGLRKGSGSQQFSLKTSKGIAEYTEFLVQKIRETINQGASTIYNTLFEEDETPSRQTQESEMHLKTSWNETGPNLWFEKKCKPGSEVEHSLRAETNVPSVRFMTYVMRVMEVGKLLARGITLREIHLFLAPSFRDLLFMKFSLRDIKVLEETNQVCDLANIYGIGCKELRVVLGSQMTIQNLLSYGWNSKTFRTLGIYAHQLCILRLQKDNIPSFGFTMNEWIRDMCLTKIAVKILRIHNNDFQQPAGILAQAGWNLEDMIYHLNISPEEVSEFKLGGRSSCKKSNFVSASRSTGPTPTPKHKMKLLPPGIMSYANVAKINPVPISPPLPLLPPPVEKEKKVQHRALEHRKAEKKQNLHESTSLGIQRRSNRVAQTHRQNTLRRLGAKERFGTSQKLSWRTKPTLRRNDSKNMNGVLTTCPYSSRRKIQPLQKCGVATRVHGVAYANH